MLVSESENMSALYYSVYVCVYVYEHVHVFVCVCVCVCVGGITVCTCYSEFAHVCVRNRVSVCDTVFACILV